MSRVTIGKIARVRGIKGEMVVVPLTDDPRRYFDLERVTISKEETTREFVIEKVRELRGKILLRLRQVENPEEARKLVGGFVEVEKEQVVKLPPGRYFVFDLVGLEVFTTQGQRIGKIKEIISLPANDIYVIQGDEKQYDIPALKTVVKKIDIQKGEMIIEPLEGLLDA
jgi:16S rRNA processing protein RimM